MSNFTKPSLHNDCPEKEGAAPLSAAPLAISRRNAMKALFAAAGAAVLFGMPRTAHAARATQETLDALSDAESQLDAAQSELNAIGDQFQALSVELDGTITKIEGVQEQIDETQKQIDKKQAELEEQQAVLSERVADSYKGGPNSALSLLLSSASFDELISNTRYIEKINDRDKQAIEEVHRIQQELNAQKSELEEQKSDLETLKADQAAKLSEMQAKQAEAQQVIDGLSQDVRDLMAKRDAEYLASAQEEERQRKAAEEAAKNQGGSVYIPGNGQGTSNITGSQQSVVNACHSTPSPGAGLCAMWVSQVFNRAGFPYVGGNANDMYNAYCTSSNKADLKVGMVIAVPTHSHNLAGQIYGHIGIYVGNNQVMENIGSVQTTNLDTWIGYYGTTVTPRWGWLGGWVLT